MFVVVAVAGLVLIGGGYFAVRTFLSADFTRNADNMFGDQNLKTVVALVELHKVRYGRYPASLKDLKFTGQWDQLALQSVLYTSNPDGSAYYVEVSRGWAGKPTKDLKFTGQWDQLALQSVLYTSNPDGSAYYVEVSRGWAGKPTFTMPLEFWHGTGYSEALRPS